MLKNNKLNLFCYIIPAAIAAGTSLLSGIVGSSSTKKENQKQRDWQSNQNQLDRDFNASEAQKSRDYQSQMYYEDRRYNSIKNQMKLYTEAGLNPSLMMSDGAQSIQGSMPTASSASSHGGSASLAGNPGQYLAGGIQGAGEVALQQKQLEIQDKLANSQARLNNADASGKEIENDISSALKAKTIERNGVKLQFDIDMDKTQRDTVAAQLDEIYQKIDESKSKSNLFAQQAAFTTEQWQAQQYENLIHYSPLGYQMDGVDTDSMEYNFALYVGCCLLLNDASQLPETNSRIKRNLAAADESWTNATIGGYTIKQLKSDYDRGLITLKTDLAEYNFRNVLGQLKVDVKVNEDLDVQKSREETLRNKIKSGEYTSEVAKYSEPVSKAIEPVSAIIDLFYSVGTKGIDAFSSLFGSSDESGESFTTREVLGKDGEVHELKTHTTSSKSKTSQSRSRSSKRRR